VPKDRAAALAMVNSGFGRQGRMDRHRQPLIAATLPRSRRENRRAPQAHGGDGFKSLLRSAFYTSAHGRGFRWASLLIFLSFACSGAQCHGFGLQPQRGQWFAKLFSGVWFGSDRWNRPLSGRAGAIHILRSPLTKPIWGAVGGALIYN